MWIFTRYGFFSVAYAGDLPPSFWIRARARKHLEALIARFNYPAEIMEDARRDYRYRITVTKAEWGAMLLAFAEEQDWSNFKNEVARFTKDDTYIEATHVVWEVMHQAGMDWVKEEKEVERFAKIRKEAKKKKGAVQIN
jgi:hypothetical protein